MNLIYILNENQERIKKLSQIDINKHSPKKEFFKDSERKS